MKAEEMTVYGKPGKRSSRFPPFPQTLEIEPADFHIPSTPILQPMIENRRKNQEQRSLPRKRLQTTPSGSSFNWKRLRHPFKLHPGDNLKVQY